MIAAPGDGDARRIIRDEIDATLVVEAAAGTGKTTELVNRILAVLRTGRARVHEIVAVTFTEKAAGELKLRLRQCLEEERRKAIPREEIARLDDAVQNLEEAHVSTIHGFCADLLRERPVEARVDPLFRVLTESQAQRLFDEAFDRWFRGRIEDPPEGMRRSLRRAGRGFRGDGDDGPIDRLRRAGFELAQWRDFRAGWTRDPFDRREAIDRAVGLLHALADVSRQPSYRGDNLFADTEPARRLSRDLRSQPPSDDPDGAESLLIELRRNRDFRRGRKGSGASYGPAATRAQVLDARTALVEALNEFEVRADADLAACLHGELQDCVSEYEALKARHGALDFLDLLLRARDLIAGDAAVRRHFQRRFARIFVDEFQDTDPLQAELLVLLAASDPDETRWRHVTPVPGKLFIVGDPKQSIYRFRRADVGTYREVRDLLVARGARAIELRRSFRAVPTIQQAVNAAFAPLMDGATAAPAALPATQARYIPLEPSRTDHTGQPGVVVLPVPRPYGGRFISAKAIEESLPAAVGAYVEWLVTRSGWTVTERRNPEQRVPLEARHVCILFRRFLSYGADVTRPYVEALEARGVRHLLVGGRTFHDREEIETLRAALMAIEWPDDQLSVFATLRGALFAVSDEDLLEYHHLSGRFHPFRIPDALPQGLEPVREALQLLAGLHRERNRRPVAETITTLLDRTRAHVGFVLRPGGEQALANVLHVAELARQYELEGGMSFRGFIEALQDEDAAGRGHEAPVLEEGSDGVRLMTVHKAKGLEFPVVILADLTARLTPFEAGRHVDPSRDLCALRLGGWSPKELNEHRDDELRLEQEEAIRVAYVAATRARDLLVVPAVGDEPYPDGWLSPLDAAIYPAESARRVQQRGPGCPAFASRDSVLERPDGDPASAATVCPGEHVMNGPAGSYSVVWWAPTPDVLPLEAERTYGLRRDDLIVKDIPPQVLRAHLAEYEAWRTGRDSAVAAAATPSIAVATAIEASAMAVQADGVEVSVESAGSTRARPGGRRFGTLVHALLADVPLPFEGEALLRALSQSHGRALAATPEEIEAAFSCVREVLGHPVLQAAARAAAAGRCHRETAVTWRSGPGAIVEGIVDLAFDAGDEYVVVDFKTDRELDGAIDRYQRQVQIYAAAIAASTGRRARAVLMRV